MIIHIISTLHIYILNNITRLAGEKNWDSSECCMPNNFSLATLGMRAIGSPALFQMVLSIFLQHLITLTGTLEGLGIQLLTAYT
jgi:hypothetical protein